MLEKTLDLFQFRSTEFVKRRNWNLVDNIFLDDLSFKTKLAANHQNIPKSRSAAQRQSKVAHQEPALRVLTGAVPVIAFAK